MNYVEEKLVDLVLALFVHVFKVLSPIKTAPKLIETAAVDAPAKIQEVRVENRLNSNLYDILLAGISKQPFTATIITDSGAIVGKTVEHMEVNTDRMIVEAVDRRNNNRFWILRIGKLGPKETLTLRLKVQNVSPVLFRILHHSSTQTPVTEDQRGVVGVPFKVTHVPEI